jgi:hypothetical protein
MVQTHAKSTRPTEKQIWNEFRVWGFHTADASKKKFGKSSEKAKNSRQLSQKKVRHNI